MGASASLCNLKSKKRLILSGLSRTVQTTIFYQLLDPCKQPQTVKYGYPTETFKYKQFTFSIMDINIPSGLFDFWRPDYGRTHGVLFVIDSTDDKRLNAVKDELSLLLNHSSLQNSMFAILCNKHDLPNAMSTDDICRKLKLCTVIETNLHFFKEMNPINTLFESCNVPDAIIDLISEYLPNLRGDFVSEQRMETFECNAISGDGLSKAIDWISQGFVTQISLKQWLLQ